MLLKLCEMNFSIKSSGFPAAYLGFSETCISHRYSQTSLTNHSSGRTAYPTGWRASAGSRGLVWCQHSLHSSKDNSVGRKRMVLCSKFHKTEVHHLLSFLCVLEPTGSMERWCPSTVLRAVAAVTYICVSCAGAILACALSLRLTALRDRDKAHKLLRWGRFPMERRRKTSTKFKI